MKSIQNHVRCWNLATPRLPQLSALALATVIGSVDALGGTVRYVDVNSPGPQAPYESWETAARAIQDAVDVALPGDDVVVADGVYATGGRPVYGSMTNRVSVTKPLTLRSVNGAIRCVYLTNGASLSGFTLTNGATLMGQFGPPAPDGGGGGVWCESTNAFVTNCIIVGNSAWSGGGAYSGTLNRCELRSNTAHGIYGTYMGGGGPAWGTLNNCTIQGNGSHSTGGGTLVVTMNNCLVLSNTPIGAYGGTANNCTVVGNNGTGAFGYYWGKSGELCTLNNTIVYYNTEDLNSFGGLYSGYNCCVGQLTDASRWFSPGTTITNVPQFVNLAAGNLRLQPGSPCINAGVNAYAPAGTDLDGNLRIVGGTVDIGAYEFQGTDPTPFSVWLARYGLPTDGSADYIDSDKDGMTNWQEYLAGTNPTNAPSALRLLTPVCTNNILAVTWESVLGMSYVLERNALPSHAPWAFLPLATNLFGNAGITTFIDTNPISSPGLLYRMGVKSQ